MNSFVTKRATHEREQEAHRRDFVVFIAAGFIVAFARTCLVTAASSPTPGQPGHRYRLATPPRRPHGSPATTGLTGTPTTPHLEVHHP